MVEQPPTKWKLVKITYSAQFDRVVRVPIALAVEPDLLGGYLDVGGNFVFSDDVIKAGTLTISAAEEVQPPPDDASFIQDNGFGHRVRSVDSPIYSQICVLCLITDFDNITRKFKESCPNPISDEDYRTAKKNQLGTPLN